MNSNGAGRRTHVHFIGIGGSGLSAIARLLNESGYAVTGSDRVLSPFAVDLQSAGVNIHIGHDPRNIRAADWVVRSSAVPDDNVEVQAAGAAGIPVYRRADFLGRLMEDRIGIAVAGTHGKTTTTAMIAYVLSEMGCDPSFIVGGTLSNYGVNARAGKGRAFVIEADEYDRMFLGLQPQIEVITNLEHDHPDCYPKFQDMVTAFESFVALLPQDGTLIACLDDARAADLLAKAQRLGRQAVGYSLQNGAAPNAPNAPRWMQARNAILNPRGGFDFEAATNAGGAPAAVSLQVPGEHNILNALATLSVAAVLDLSVETAARALGKFAGTGRRFEIKGERKGIVVIDDYAHHPTEIRATLAAAKLRYTGRRIWAVWQPHTYSRTKLLFSEFASSFADADETIVTEIYAAREPRQDFSSRLIVEAMPQASKHFAATLQEATTYLLAHLRPNDIVLVLSAGDADQITAQVLAALGK
jgi:UDP-N-acetylmuramate--alanine ligase